MGAETILPGYRPDDDKSGELLAVSVAFIVILTVVMILYYAARYVQTKSITGVEMKFLMPLGYLSCLAVCISGILIVKVGGAGHHVEYVPVDKLMQLAKLIKAIEALLIFAIYVPKLSILSLYIRLFIDPTVRRLSICTGIFIIATMVAGTFDFAFMCRPFAYNWNKTIPGGHCIDIMASYTYFSIPSLLSDLVIILLPLRSLWTLQVPRGTKIGLLVTFIMGGLGMVTGIIRFVEFLTNDLFADISWTTITTAKWCIIEPGMYQIAATMPTLRPLLTKTVSSLGFPPILSRISNMNRSRGAQIGIRAHIQDERGSGFLKLDDYHYLQSPGSYKPKGVLYSGNSQTHVSAVTTVHEEP